VLNEDIARTELNTGLIHEKPLMYLILFADIWLKSEYTYISAVFTLFIPRLITRSADTDHNRFSIPDDITNQATERMLK